jgi:dTDP-4-dehydrorhamnose 3,5-epimerase
VSSFKVLEIDGVRINKLKISVDSRGSFFKFHPLDEIVNPLDSVALSMNPVIGTVRGLHFQVNPFAEEKLVTCIQGSIFDVIVDLRPESKTFGKWASFELNEVDLLQLYLPKGIAHGFQTLLPNSIVHYSLTAQYSPNHSFAIDPFGDLDIPWPLDPKSLSDRDRNGLTFAEASEKYANSIGLP